MKHQYVGDVNDFVKYGLLRALTDVGRRSSFVAWLLTPSDYTADGRRLQYLDAPSTWRPRDPELFDSLGALVRADRRSVEQVAAVGILPGTRFYSEVVPQDKHARRQHFEEMLRQATGHELVFFDPDNGLEVDSCRVGSRNSPKYLLWRELSDTYLAGHSVLVYQHFPRRDRRQYIDHMSQRITAATGATEVLAFRTAHVVFFLAPQQSQTEFYADRMSAVEAQWKGVIDSVSLQLPNERCHPPD